MRQAYKHVVGIETTSSYPTKDHAWNEISARYVPVEEYYIPEIWRRQSEDNKQASEGPIDSQEEAKDKYKTALALIKHYYDELLKLGVAKEQARVLLPLAAYTEVYWTASFQAIVNFIELRDEPTAQWEIREYAKVLKKLLFGIYPKTAEIWSDLYWEQKMKIFISVFFLLTSVVSMLILVGRKMSKPFKSCGESCECIDEEILGYEGLPSLNYRGDCLY